MKGTVFCAGRRAFNVHARLMGSNTANDIARSATNALALKDHGNIFEYNERRLKEGLLPVNNVWLQNFSVQILCAANNHNLFVSFVSDVAEVKALKLNHKIPNLIVLRSSDEVVQLAVKKQVIECNIDIFNNYLADATKSQTFYTILVNEKYVLDGFYLSVRKFSILSNYPVPFKVSMSEDDVKLHIQAAENHGGAKNIQTSNKGFGPGREISDVKPRAPFSLVHKKEGTYYLFEVTPPKSYIEMIPMFKIKVGPIFLEKVRQLILSSTNSQIIGNVDELPLPKGVFRDSSDGNFIFAFPSMLASFVVKAPENLRPIWASLRIPGSDPKTIVTKYLKEKSYRVENGIVNHKGTVINISQYLMAPTIYPTVLDELQGDSWAITPGNIPEEMFSFQ
jgi:hypothetical protein